jgi:hypothetical protein
VKPPEWSQYLAAAGRQGAKAAMSMALAPEAKTRTSKNAAAQLFIM